MTGSETATLQAAALKAVPEATVERIETDADGAACEVHLKKSDGSEVAAEPDSALERTGIETGHAADAPNGSELGGTGRPLLRARPPRALRPDPGRSADTASSPSEGGLLRNGRLATVQRMAMGERSSRAGTRVVAAWALVLVALTLGVGPALAASPSATDRSAQVQAMLDRVLGPGNSVVEIAATISAGSGSVSSVRWGRALPSGIAVHHLRTALGTSSGSSQVDAVDRTTTVLNEPPGALVRQTVAVAVDRRAMHGIPLHRLRRLIVTAAGVTRIRGDRLFLLETTFPRAVPTTAPARAWTDLVPFAVPAVEIGGGVAAALILITAVRGRRPRSRDLGRS